MDSTVEVASYGQFGRGQQMAEPFKRMLYDRKSAAQQLSISVRSLDYMISRQHLPIRRIGSRILIRHEDLKKFSRGNHTENIVPSSARIKKS
jgi:excisionase family DNA binding protein